MSLVMSISFVVGLFTLLGLAAWAVVDLDMSREVLPPSPSIDASPDESLDETRDESRELVGQHAS